MKRYISPVIKDNAINLRKSGESIGQIAQELSVAKSTIYEWTKTIEGASKYAELGRRKWIKEIQPLGALGQKLKRERIIDSIVGNTKDEVNKIDLPKDTQKAMLAMLYLSEGSKVRGTLSFANTDPKLMLLFITLFRRCYSIEESKFRVRLHLHWYHKEKEVRQFWSKLLNIPENKFGKIYHKHRSKEKKFRKNFGGICYLRYNNEYLREQIIHFGYALGEKITGHIDVPIA